ncbi:hypothetical protein Q6269_30315, partial [Klebsiella pneumoniae]|nr:hypothetical protein [Klebsiella pneumoniae]
PDDQTQPIYSLLVKDLHMPDRFEILHKDLAGRIGRLSTLHGTVETPLLMPVINPPRPLIPPDELASMGAEMVITNS